MDVNDYDLIKVKEYMKINHQLVFSHIVMVDRRNKKLKAEYDKMARKRM